MPIAFRSYSLLAAGVGALALATPLHAETINWIGTYNATDGEVLANDIRWADNWDSDVPGSGDVGVIGDGQFAYVSWYHDLTLPPGTENGQLDYRGASNKKDGNVAAGTANNSTPVLFDGGLLVETGGELNFQSLPIDAYNGDSARYEIDFTLDGGTASSSHNFSLHFGTITVTENGGVFDSGSGVNLYGEINLGGELTFKGAELTRELISGVGSLRIESSNYRAFRENNTYSGGTTVASGGFLNVAAAGGGLGYGAQGYLGTGDLVIESGGRALVGYADLATPLNPFNDTDSTVFIQGGGELQMYRATGFDITADDGAILQLLQGDGTYDYHYDGDISLNGQVVIRDAQGGSSNRSFTGNLSDGDNTGSLLITGVDPTAGTSLLTLTNSNTFTGGVTLDNGARVLATAANALGLGDVTINAHEQALLVLADDGAINAAAALTLLADGGIHGTVQLDNVDITVASLTLAGVNVAGGTYSVGDTALGSYFTGTGSVTVVPEPASLVLLGLGTLMIGVRRSSRA